MGLLTILEPLPIAGVAASRGSGAANLATADPKEAWIDAAAGGQATLTVDLGAARSVDTIYLGAIQPAGSASWSIAGGLASAGEAAIQGATPIAGRDAVWTGAARTVRYLAITLANASAEPLSVGIVAAGLGFNAALGQEWGAGRQPIDTGTATPLPGGGFAIVEGVRKRAFSWTFGDLSAAETLRLEAIALALGETRPGLVVEFGGAAPVCLWGLFKRWQPFERRNRAQTRWEVGIEQWV